MKKQFSVFDALFILFLYFKLSGTGPSMKWWECFSPYIMECGFTLLGFLYTLFNVGGRLKFILWRKAMRIRVKVAAKKAKDQILKKFEEGARSKQAASNPGRAHWDEENGYK
jgi:hypothetical protein